MATTNDEESKILDDMKNIIDPRDNDVLCGRGGAALRHPGNQCYRRLVNLNKSLYITCLKTEKLKISRSIVAAIREQNGRFLERDAKAGVWNDIGDKKAIEKTSQALREGQPKLRKQMVERGQIPPDQLVGVEHTEYQYGNGIYDPRQQRQQSMTMNGFNGSGDSISNLNGLGLLQQHNQLMLMRRNQILQHQQLQLQQQIRNSLSEMPPPPLRSLSSEMNDTNEVAMLQRLSLTTTPQSIPSWTPSIASVDFMDDEPQLFPARSRSRTSTSRYIPSHDGATNNEINFSRINQGDIDFHPEKRIGSFDPSVADMEPERQQQHHNSTYNSDHDQNNGVMSNIGNNDQQRSAPTIDQRRRVFAKTKTARNSQERSSPYITDSMPDINMVNSQFSLLSNLSKHDSKHSTTMDISIRGANKESMGSEYIGVGSRRSLMSGLSKLSGHSDINNVFSNMSKKIGGTNHSTRSIALSEFSGIDEEEFAEDDFDFDLPPMSPNIEKRKGEI